MNNPIRASGTLDHDSASRIGVTVKPVTIIVPCFNEEEGLPQLAEHLRQLPCELPHLELSFVIVDDGSTDDTWQAMTEEFSGHERVVMIRHAANLGIAAAMETGADLAQDEIVAVIDSDCTYDPKLIGDMVPLLTGDVQMVTASPYHHEGKVAGVAAWRIFLSQNASRLYRLLLKNKLATYTSCFRVYRRKALLSISREHNGFVGVTEILVRFDQKGWRVVEHPATLTTRKFGQSKLSVARAISGHLKFLAWIAYARTTRQWN